MRLPFFRSKEATAEPAGAPKRPRGVQAAAPAAEEADVAAARTQARRRLVGALLLLAVGVIGFPLLFETQPRPLPQDTPLILPESTAPRPAAPPPMVKAPAAPPAEAGVETVVAAAPAVRASQAPQRPASAAAPGTKPVATAPVAAPAPALRPAPDPAPPRPAASAPAVTGRFVVQVGAYDDADRVKAVRAQLQKLGQATFTQNVDTAAGRRTRVRIGPFKTRAEADAAAARAKSAGLQVVVLSL